MWSPTLHIYTESVNVVYTERYRQTKRAASFQKGFSAAVNGTVVNGRISIHYAVWPLIANLECLENMQEHVPLCLSSHGAFFALVVPQVTQVGVSGGLPTALGTNLWPDDRSTAGHWLLVRLPSRITCPAYVSPQGG